MDRTENLPCPKWISSCLSHLRLVYILFISWDLQILDWWCLRPPDRFSCNRIYIYGFGLPFFSCATALSSFCAPPALGPWALGTKQLIDREPAHIVLLVLVPVVVVAAFSFSFLPDSLILLRLAAKSNKEQRTFSLPSRSWKFAYQPHVDRSIALSVYDSPNRE